MVKVEIKKRKEDQSKIFHLSLTCVVSKEGGHGGMFNDMTKGQL